MVNISAEICLIVKEIKLYCNSGICECLGLNPKEFAFLQDEE